MTDPNPQQKQVIQNTEGIYLVDAGPGTGKTFSITRRYKQILQEGNEPQDIFLATFTNNAAEEMKERIIEITERDSKDLLSAPISTFHSYCNRIIKNNCYQTPQRLQINDHITEEVEIMENNIREQQRFSHFYQQFKRRNTQYSHYYEIVENERDLLNLIKSLASKGIIPEEEGWYLDTGKTLQGDEEEFKQKIKEVNKPQDDGKGNTKQSELRRRTYSLKWKNFLSDAPTIDEIRGDYGTKKVRKDLLEKAFNQNREQLKEFVHQLYYEYLEYAIRNNYLNFNFVLALSYVELINNPQLREEKNFKYIMIDEFQDTNEIQLKIALLLSEQTNICAVGDWKQSIYSFQYASVENILNFEKRIKKYSKSISQHTKFNLDINKVNKITLKQNYRSRKEIIDKSQEAFKLPANKYEILNPDNIEGLKSDNNKPSKIGKFSKENEIDAILSKINEIVNNEDYKVKDDRKPEFKDITVLTRTRNFGKELQKEANKRGIPTAFEAGKEIFNTPQGKILLAWLKILSNNHREGWSVTLEKQGYTLEQAKDIIEKEKYPDEMLSFKKELGNLDKISTIAQRIFYKYRHYDSTSKKIIDILDQVFGTNRNLPEIIDFVQDNIEQGKIYPVDLDKGDNHVKIKTMHGAKGLEFPITFISNINQGNFPISSSSNSVIDYQDPIGLQQRKILETTSDGDKYIFDNWKSELLSKALSGDYDEERRLMYVAMTRAEDHLFFTAEKDKESQFYKKLDVDEVDVDLDFKERNYEYEDRKIFKI